MITQTTSIALTSGSRASRGPRTRGILIGLDAGPVRFAILYADPKPEKKSP
jgi:hypothetical protein